MLNPPKFLYKRNFLKFRGCGGRSPSPYGGLRGKVNLYPKENLLILMYDGVRILKKIKY